jgi:hypothetical protein
MSALEADHAAKVVVVTVAQDQCIETCRVDLKNRHVVQQHFVAAAIILSLGAINCRPPGVGENPQRDEI